MKKFFFIIPLVIAMFACKSKSTEENTVLNDTSIKYAVYQYKVVGLNDSIIADSVWKIIFKVDGVDELNIDLKDSLIIVKGDVSKTSKELIAKEIEARGAKVLPD